MIDIKNHPLYSVETFTKWMENSFGCVHCKYLEINDLPVDKWKCTHEFAFIPSEDYPKGIEYEKEWIRQDDIKRELDGELTDRKDANLYFMCFHFANEDVDLQNVIEKITKK